MEAITLLKASCTAASALFSQCLKKFEKDSTPSFLRANSALIGQLAQSVVIGRLLIVRVWISAPDVSSAIMM